MIWLPTSAGLTQSIIGALLVLILPGAAWQAWGHSRGRDGLERLADVLALSFALITLLAGILPLLGLNLTPVVAALLGGFGLGMLLIGLTAGLVTHRLRWTRRDLILLLVGLLLMAAVSAWRLVQARDLLLPAWVDSVHHTLIVQKFLDNAGLPATLAPELNVPFNYHYGFHAAAALFAAVSGQSAADAVLWFGQITNALIALAAYRLSKAFFGDVRKALAAALLVGFFTQMPAYYISWGRYSLSAGLVMLGPAMAAALEVSRPGAGWRGWGRLLILTAGILLAHYMAAVLLAVFLLLLGAGRLAQALLARWRARRTTGGAQRSLSNELWRRAVRLSAAVLLGVMLVAPRLYDVLTAFRGDMQISTVSPLPNANLDYLEYTLNLLGPTRSHEFLILAGVALLLANFRKPVRPAALWAAVMLLLALPWGLRLGPFRPDLMAIVLFLPAALLVGELLVAGTDALGRRTRRWLGAALLPLLLLGLLVWGAKETKTIANPSTQFINAADLSAIAWVEANTPPEARFFINASGWQGSTYRGVDGGYWLLPLTRRGTLMPPVLYTLAGPEEIAYRSRTAQKAMTITTCDEAFWELMGENSLDYVYVKQGVGSLQAAGLRGCDGLIPVYERDGVSLFEVVRP